MRKVFSLVIGACFLLNNVSFALCPPLISGNFAEDSHEYKFFILAEIGLQNYLKHVDKLIDIDGARDKALIKKAFRKRAWLKKNKTFRAERTIYNPAEITTCPEELDQIGEGSSIFMVPVFVEKNGIREDYRLLFSTDKDGNNGYPTALCTLEEFNAIKNEVSARKILPQRNAESAEKLAKIKYQYLTQNDGIIDPFLEKRIKTKDFTEIKNRVEKVLGWNRSTFPGRRTPEKYLAEKHSDYIRSKLNDFLKHIGTDFDETFKNKNIVFIRVPDSISFPIIHQEQGGVDLEVTSHTSERAVYTLLKEKDYDRLMAEENVTSDVEKTLEKIVKDMAHEAGVIYRSPWILTKTVHNENWRYSTGLDVLCDWREMFSNGASDEMTEKRHRQILDTVKSTIKNGPANLDHLVARGGIHREYAAAKSCPFGTEDANVIQQLIDTSSALSETTDEFIKQAEWEPILGAEAYKLLIKSLKVLPHKFNYNSTHVKALEKILNKFSREEKKTKSPLADGKIDVDYIQCFFETLFKGCACKLTVTKHFASSLPLNWKTRFSDPPDYALELMQITVTHGNKNKDNKISNEFIINVASGGKTGFDGDKIYIEAFSEDTRKTTQPTLDGSVAKYPTHVILADAGIYKPKKHKMLQIPAFARMTEKGVLQQTLDIKVSELLTESGRTKFDKMIDTVLDTSAPEWVENCISPNLNGLLKISERSAFIFSQKVTFKYGVGRLLPKLAKAGLKIAVVAKTPAERTTIDYLNAVELEDTDNKISYGKDVSLAAATIQGAQNFSYFRIEEDGEEFIPKNCHVMKDLTVRGIIDSLGKACGFVGEEMEKIYTAAEIFAKAV
ncbi:MAG: hypothetical protein ISS33_05250 [Candidatus Omnitrophica bacterium]|nr:hypothetical protein [Candidatus Omnitrophota bacterium]